MAGFSSGGVGVCPLWVSGFLVGRVVKSHVVQGNYAYSSHSSLCRRAMREGGGGASRATMPKSICVGITSQAHTYAFADRRLRLGLHLVPPTPSEAWVLEESGQEGCARARVPWPVA